MEHGDQLDHHVIRYADQELRKLASKLHVSINLVTWRGWYAYERNNMSGVENINPETHPIPASWVPRVITGGKGPTGTGVGRNWLSELQLRSVFACRQNDKTLDWEMFFLVHKFDEIYMLKWEMPDGNTYTRRVDPAVFSNIYKDYRLIEVLPELTIEAPEGDGDGSIEQHHQD